MFYIVEAHFTSCEKHTLSLSWYRLLYLWAIIQTYNLPLKHLTWWSMISMGTWYQVHPFPLTVPDLCYLELLVHLMCYLSLEPASFSLFLLHNVSRCGLKAWHYTCIWCRIALLNMFSPRKACMLNSLCEIRQWNSNEQQYSVTCVLPVCTVIQFPLHPKTCLTCVSCLCRVVLCSMMFSYCYASKQRCVNEEPCSATVAPSLYCKNILRF